jgi:hypothetical protein
MADPNWNKGFYYKSIPPHVGMKVNSIPSCIYVCELNIKHSSHAKLPLLVTDLVLNGNFALVVKELMSIKHQRYVLTS